ncbi:MAG: LON peptidase substrate-binding domain-containing protein [Bacteroidetes bacterium]|nr:LON peptidase substrate-binding domain-containing protein [Bacteroidota bacterium]MBS1629253.1 LON peptidase substrate-binding domain-containing protein [Bacteroidota bacterium]
MTHFIPIFPLRIVVFPGEALNLHIFEPRYRQLIHECLEEKKPFGIPPVMEKDLQHLGTLMELTELVKEYPDGRMDIRTRGLSVFRVLHRVEEVPEKLYAGAIVTYPDNVIETGRSMLAQKIIAEVQRLYELLNERDRFPEGRALNSYDLGHLVGLSLQQEYELLGIFTEIQRLEYLRRHLSNMVPVIQELEAMKARIRRNGHFQNLSLGGEG